MTSLSSLTPAPNSLAPLPADAAAPATGAGRTGRVRAVEYVAPVKDSLQDRTRQAGTQQPETRQPQVRRGLVPWSEETDGRGLRGPEFGASALFLVQVFGQDQAPPHIALMEHRDAAVLGSDAYRRAGATPPVYSEQPTLFRIAV